MLKVYDSAVTFAELLQDVIDFNARMKVWQVDNNLILDNKK